MAGQTPNWIRTILNYLCRFLQFDLRNIFKSNTNVTKTKPIKNSKSPNAIGHNSGHRSYKISSYAERALNYICKFLRFDLMTLFKSESMQQVALYPNASNIIEHNFGTKLKIYLGKPTKRWYQYQNSNRVEYDDDDDDDTDNDDMTNAENDSDDDSSDYDAVLNPIQQSRLYISKTNHAINDQSLCCSPSPSASPPLNWLQNKNNLSNLFSRIDVEKRAKNLYQRLHLKQSSSNWWNLENWRKLGFYWTALCNDVLSEEALKNFKRFYSSNVPRGRKSTRTYNEKLLNTWRNLSNAKKLPFIMEAFIAKVSAGKVNICDERELQRMVEI